MRIASLLVPSKTRETLRMVTCRSPMGAVNSSTKTFWRSNDAPLWSVGARVVFVDVGFWLAYSGIFSTNQLITSLASCFPRLRSG